MQRVRGDGIPERAAASLQRVIFDGRGSRCARQASFVRNDSPRFVKRYSRQRRRSGHLLSGLVSLISSLLQPEQSALSYTPSSSATRRRKKSRESRKELLACPSFAATYSCINVAGQREYFPPGICIRSNRPSSIFGNDPDEIKERLPYVVYKKFYFSVKIKNVIILDYYTLQ